MIIFRTILQLIIQLLSKKVAVSNCHNIKNYYSQNYFVLKIHYANDFSSPVLCRQHNAVINKPQSHETRRDCTSVGNFAVQILSVTCRYRLRTTPHGMEELFVASLSRRLKLLMLLVSEVRNKAKRSVQAHGRSSMF